MEYHGYEIDSKWENADGDLDWHVTGSGAFVTGEKDGVSYFLKRSVSVRYPDKSLPTATYNMYLNDFRKIRDKQNEIAKRLKDTALAKDRIVRETENFVDDHNYYVTVTPFLAASVPSDKAGISSLSLLDFLSLALSSAQDIAKLHACHVIHGDLKPDNFIYLRNRSTYDCYVMDFDISYPDDQVLDDQTIGGTEGYMAPELIAYIRAEGDLPSSTITPKIDVFSLALTWHFLWAGALPEAGKYPSVGDALLAKTNFRIDEKFDVNITKGVCFKDLLMAMLSLDPTKRPSAQEVVDILLGKKAALAESKPAAPFLPKLWPTDELAAELLSVEELKAKGLVGFEQKIELGRRLYHLTRSEKEETVSLDGLIERGFAKKKDRTPKVETAWPEDKLAIADPATLESHHVKGIKKAGDAAHPFYVVTMESGLMFSWDAQTLVAQGLAKKSAPAAAPHAVEFDDGPYKEDGAHYLPEAAARQHYVRIKKSGDGQHYDVVKEDGTTLHLNGKMLRFYGVIK